MIYGIGSFNMRGLQEKNDKPQDFNAIAEIIKGQYTSSRKRSPNPFHLVALQEVVNEEQFHNFLLYLGPDWEGWHGRPKGFSPQSEKGYAFIWNKRYVQLMYSEKSKEEFYEPHIISPLTDNNVSIDFKNLSLTRCPLYGRFRLLSCETEIRLINTHIAFGVPKAKREEEEIDTSDIKFRIDEYNVLAHQIYPAINKTCYKNGFQNYYTILLGDYNLNLTRSWVANDRIFQQLNRKGLLSTLTPTEQSALKSALRETLPSIKENEEKYVIDDQNIITIQEELTTLRNNKVPQNFRSQRVESELIKRGITDEVRIRHVQGIANLAEHEFRTFCSSYDHFTVDQCRMNQISYNVRRIDDPINSYMKKYSVTTLEEAAEIYKQKVSDHIPTMISMDLRNGK